MFALLVLIAVVYGGSLFVAAVVALLSAVSPAFRRLIVDHRSTGA